MAEQTLAERATTIPRLLVAGVASGVGKTTVTVALARALTARGLRVAMFKCGPDYLDPTYHRRAAGRASHNLDAWMMGREAVRDTFASASAGCDLALIEGVMGLYDGVDPRSSEGSSAEIARMLEAPVLLVLDAAGMARSVAALVHGFATLEPDLRIAGVICNRVGSARHLALLAQACAAPLPPVLGGMLASDQRFPSRHLGLHSADEALTEAELDACAEGLLAHTDLERLLAVARSAPPLCSEQAAASPRPSEQTSTPTPSLRSRRCRIGVARDAAFSFYYPYNLTLLERLGAELVYFSPLAEPALPDVDGVYFGGGYPELHAHALADNHGLRASLRAFAARGRPVYGECGGLMFLSDAIVTLDGVRHPMMGLVPGVATMQPKLAALGYVEVETRAASILGPSGQAFRGHQFRYSDFRSAQLPQHFLLRTRRDGSAQREGYGHGSVLASYVHAHWASNPALAEHLVRACESGM